MVTGKLKNKQVENERCWSVSTLLIPDAYLVYYKEQCKKHSSRRNYFQYLARHGLPQLKQLMQTIERRRSLKWKTHYQNQGLVLIKQNFVPFPSDWEDFRHSASVLGVSICFLAAFLIELEMLGKIKAEKNGNSFMDSLLMKIFFWKFNKMQRRISFSREILYRKQKRRR